MNLCYVISGEVVIHKIDDLRLSVGWNSMMEYCKKSLCHSYFYICWYDDENLVGFIDVVSNHSSDAYIQDLMVKPNYQSMGIGTTLMSMTIDKLKKENIYAISVLFEERLMGFYKRFGFYIMNAGQIINE